MTSEDTREHLPEHIRALLSPETYDHPVQEVELIQTHVSYVILAGPFAYKLRKAVNLGFLDFTTLEARKRDCAEEVRLNHRTCSALYLGVLSVSRDGGRYRLGGPGEVVDYAVQMRRLPPERMLSNLLDAGAVDFAMMGRLVSKLTKFHATADGSRRVREAGGYHNHVSNWASNLREAEAYVPSLMSPQQFDTVRAYADGFLHDNRALLERREDDGRIRDCHGDLRADAICFDSAASPDGICIFDCLEFSERHRFADTGLDVCFLAMDLERRGYVELADIFLSLYTAAMGDKTLPLVSRLYRSYRALIRGKVAGILAGQREVPEEKRRAAEAEARLHFELAATYARPNAGPGLTVVMGLSGSGKSVLAGALAHRIGAALLSTDIVRKEMVGALPTQRRRAPVGADLYAPDMTQRAYSEMLRQAEAFLLDGRAVVLDGTFITRDLRAPVLELVQRAAAPLNFVVCEAPEDVIRTRQVRRALEAWSASDATWEVYQSQKDRYEPPSEAPAAGVLTNDSSRPLEQQLHDVIAMMTGGD